MKRQANTAQQTQKEILQHNFDVAEHVFREAAEEVTRLDGQVRGERKAMDQLEADYTTACRALASGGSADLNLILAEKERREHRLCGLEALLKEATERLQPLQVAYCAAARALQDEIDRLEIERMEAAIADAQKNREVAKTAFDEADKALNTAVWMRDYSPKALELKARARA